jgi:hypothetical protein
LSGRRGRRRRRDPAEAEFGADGGVVALDAGEQQHHQRHRDDDHPGAFEELGGEQDQAGQGGQQGADAVDDRAAQPAGRALGRPVPDQAGLADAEADEDADGEERDQLLRVGFDGDEQDGGQQGQGHDAVPVHGPLGA